jgi:hypothetical protein
MARPFQASSRVPLHSNMTGAGACDGKVATSDATFIPQLRSKRRSVDSPFESRYQNWLVQNAICRQLSLQPVGVSDYQQPWPRSRTHLHRPPPGQRLDQKYSPFLRRQDNKVCMRPALWQYALAHASSDLSSLFEALCHCSDKTPTHPQNHSHLQSGRCASDSPNPLAQSQLI